jgi:hypothetical protein
MAVTAVERRVQQSAGFIATRNFVSATIQFAEIRGRFDRD